jgi:vancomycin resistance protein YoaR
VNRGSTTFVTRRPAVLAMIGLAALFLLAVAERVVYRGDVMPNVSVAGVPVGKMSERDAYRAISALGARLESEPVSVRAGDVRLVFTPQEIGYDVDEEATLRSARQSARTANPIGQLVGFVQRRFRADDVGLRVRWDEQELRRLVDGWARDLTEGVVDGDLRFDGARVVAVRPRSGRGIDPRDGRQRIAALLQEGQHRSVRLPIRTIPPRVQAAAVEEAARRARRLLGGDVTVVANGETLTLTPPKIASTLETRRRGSTLDLRVNTLRLAAALGDDFDRLVDPPVDARFAVSGTTVSVVPGRNGRSPDLDAVASGILAGRRRINAPMVEVEPKRTTKWAKDLGITRLVSSFTTRFPAGQPRVKNIQRAAQLIDGTVVEPGAVFSLNETVGPRTPERGFVQAPVYYQEFTEDVGGGVSQVATTTYNAVFYGGYEVVTHKPHSIWFDRYPMAVEATVNYPTVDLKFRNDTRHGVLIETYTTSTSITVALYGDNEGRRVRKEGPTILKEYPPENKYIDWPALPEGEERQIQHGYTGYDVEVWRVIERPGAPAVRRRYFWHYTMLPNQILRGTGPAVTSVPPSTDSPPPTDSPPVEGEGNPPPEG